MIVAPWRILGLAIAGLLLAQGAVSAQGRFEVGIDGVISYTMMENVEGLQSFHVQTWAFPVQRVRVGGLDVGRLQPQLAMAFAVADYGEVSTVALSVGLSGLYRLTGSGDRSGLFLSAGGGFSLLSDNGTDVQWTGTVGLGVRTPVGARFAFRPAVEVGRSLRSDRRLAATSVSAIIGVSVFTGRAGGAP